MQKSLERTKYLIINRIEETRRPLRIVMFSAKNVTLQPGSNSRPRAWQSDALSKVSLRLMYRVTKWSKKIGVLAEIGKETQVR